MNQIERTEQTLPGLLPDVEALELARGFRVVVEGLEVLVDRMPTMVEREIMMARAGAIGRALAPIGERREDREEAAAAIASMLVGYNSTRKDKAAAETVTVYLQHLKGVPLFAIRAACEDVKAGRVYDVEKRTGNRIPLDPDFPPSTVRLRLVAQKYVEQLQGERWQFEKVLRAKRTIAAPPSEAERQRVGELFKDLQATMTASVAGDDLERAAELERKTEEQRRARDREILAEYERLGIEPMRMAGVLISPELVRSQRMYSRHVRADESDED